MNKKHKWLMGCGTLVVAGVITWNTDAVTLKRYERKADLGNKYLLEKNYDKAISEFHKAIKLAPQKLESYLAVAQAYEQVQKYESALKILQQATAIFEKAYERTGEASYQEAASKIDDRMWQLIETYPAEVGALEEWIYYSSEEYTGQIERIKIDGSEKMVLPAENVTNWKIIKDKIYYTQNTYNEEEALLGRPSGYPKKVFNNKVMSMSLDGSNEEVVAQGGENFIYVEQYLDYITFSLPELSMGPDGEERLQMDVRYGAYASDYVMDKTYLWDGETWNMREYGHPGGDGTYETNQYYYYEDTTDLGMAGTLYCREKEQYFGQDTLISGAGYYINEEDGVLYYIDYLDYSSDPHLYGLDMKTQQKTLISTLDGEKFGYFSAVLHRPLSIKEDQFLYEEASYDSDGEHSTYYVMNLADGSVTREIPKLFAEEVGQLLDYEGNAYEIEEGIVYQMGDDGERKEMLKLNVASDSIYALQPAITARGLKKKDKVDEKTKGNDSSNEAVIDTERYTDYMNEIADMKDGQSFVSAYLADIDHDEEEEFIVVKYRSHQPYDPNGMNFVGGEVTFKIGEYENGNVDWVYEHIDDSAGCTAYGTQTYGVITDPSTGFAYLVDKNDWFSHGHGSTDETYYKLEGSKLQSQIREIDNYGDQEASTLYYDGNDAEIDKEAFERLKEQYSQRQDIATVGVSYVADYTNGGFEIFQRIWE